MAGANANGEGGRYGTALQAAAAIESKDIVELLFQNGADMKIRGGKFKTALGAAVQFGTHGEEWTKNQRGLRIACATLLEYC